jgi:hypothetical protein
MSAEDLHHKIAAFQQQVETLQAAAANPGLSQGVLSEALAAFHGMASSRSTSGGLSSHSTRLQSASLGTRREK